MSWLILVTALLLELFTSSLPLLMLIFPLESNTPYIITGTTAYPRIALYMWLSFLLERKLWWKQYVKIDTLLLGVVGSSIAYIYLIAASSRRGEDRRWKAHACALYPILFFVLVGNFRCMVKWYPWQGSRIKILLYKLVRFYAAVLLTVNSLVVKALSENVAAVAYFGTTLSLLVGMLSIVVSKESAVKEDSRRGKEHVNNASLQAPLIATAVAV